MIKRRRTFFVLGFGNPGRGDDGLGPALAELIGKLDLPDVSVDADYQLTVEDAAEAARHDVVVFVDAALSGPEPFWVRRLEASPERVGFTSHGVQPGGVLALARDLFGVEPEGYLLGIRGYEFDRLRCGLSAQARANLQAAAVYLRSALVDGEIQERNADRDEDGRPAGGQLCKTAST